MVIDLEKFKKEKVNRTKKAIPEACGLLEIVKRAMARTWFLRALICGSRCKRCGKKTINFDFNALPEQVKLSHIKAGTHHVIKMLARQCPDKCDGVYGGYIRW